MYLFSSFLCLAKFRDSYHILALNIKTKKHTIIFIIKMNTAYY